MSRLLRRLVYRYIKGENRHYLADSVQNAAFRATYLQRKIANRDKNNNPIRPEVYLDESYHVCGTTWLGGNRKRHAASGKGARNFSSSMAHVTFTWMGQHTTNATFCQLQQRALNHDESLFKSPLLQFMRANKSPPFYMVTAIATMYKHLVYFTPPYHPKLHPIELIWGNMKGWISRHPAKTIDDLEETVAGSKEHIKSEDWKKAHRHIQKEENQFLRVLEEDDDE
ncbi:hypothetical protein PHMEG_00026915, partial [Phytophthora megakarya]